MPRSPQEMQAQPPAYAGQRNAPAWLNRCPTLKQAWQHSAAVLARTQDTLADAALPGVVTLAAAGSLGRMEALPHSDCDLIVIIADELEGEVEAADRIMHEVWRRLAPLDLKLPKSWGIFVEPVSAAGLTRRESLGDLNESRAIFGKRLQCLLDSQPLFREEAFSRLQRRLLAWYATAFVQSRPGKTWTYLLNDLIRYFRSYAAWQQFELKVEHDDSWYVRNAKLRTSRLTMYAGLLFLLGECSRQADADPVDWLLEKLTLTPLERLLWVMERYPQHETDVDRLLESYEVFMAAMADDAVRAALIEHAPRTLEDLPPAMIPEYRPIHDRSAAIMDILTRFVLARQNDWGPVFMRYLLF